MAAIDPACRSTSRHTRPPISISLYNHTIDLSKARPEGWHRLCRLMAEKQHAEKEPKDVHALHVIFLLMILLPTIVVNPKLLATFGEVGAAPNPRLSHSAHKQETAASLTLTLQSLRRQTLAVIVVFLGWRIHFSQHPSKCWQAAVCYYAFTSFSISLTKIKNQMVRCTPMRPRRAKAPIVTVIEDHPILTISA